MKQAYIQAFVGKKWDYYSPIFAKFATGDKFHFSFAAAFWSFFWLFYHKMYWAGLLLAIVFQYFLILLVNLAKTYELSLFYANFAHLAIMALLTGFASYYGYYRWCLRQIAVIKKRNSHLDETDLLELLQAKGGNNLWGLIIFFSLLFILLGVNVTIMWWNDPALTKEALGVALEQFGF